MKDEKRTVVLYKQGTILFRQGQKPDAVYIIKRGRVHLLKELSDTKLEIVHSLEARDFVGELEVFENIPRSLTAMIGEDAELIRIDKDQIATELRDRPEWVKELMGVLCRRLHSTEDIISKHKIRDERLQGKKNFTSFDEAQMLAILRSSLEK